MAATVRIEMDNSIVKAIQEGYTDDPWCVRLRENKEKTLGVEEKDGLLFVRGGCSKAVEKHMSNPITVLFPISAPLKPVDSWNH